MTYGLRIVPTTKPRGATAAESIAVARSSEGNQGGHREKGPERSLLSKLPRSVAGEMEAISTSAIYPKGAILFVEGQIPSGVFFILRGRVELSTHSVDGRSLILQIAEKGEPLGLSAAILGKPHEATAEALQVIQANHIPRDAFREFLKRNGEAALRVAEILSDIQRATYQEVRHLGVARSTAEKLARLLLVLTEEQQTGQGPVRVTLKFTHQEIADMIGASRETVTRLFTKLKRQRLLELEGSTLVIVDKVRLQELCKTQA